MLDYSPLISYKGLAYEELQVIRIFFPIFTKDMITSI